MNCRSVQLSVFINRIQINGNAGKLLMFKNSDIFRMSTSQFIIYSKILGVASLVIYTNNMFGYLYDISRYWTQCFRISGKCNAFRKVLEPEMCHQSFYI